MSEDAPKATASSGADWRTQEMFLIQEVMGLIGRGLDLGRVVREILHLLSELLGLNRGRVVLADGDVHAIRFAYGLTAEEMARGRYRRGEGITGQAIAEGRLVILQDVDEGGFLFRSVARAKLPPGTVAYMAMPLVADGRIAGAIGCHRIRHRERQLADDVAMLRIAATLIGQLLTLNARVEQKTRALEQQNAMLSRALRHGRARYGIIGASPALLRAVAQVEKVSAASASVLLLGDSGTGKELFARALHIDSPRRDGPFITVNCAAIPDALFESELFGHERGAFTGAMAARAGSFERARGGTLFLDEIGEMPLLLQSKLLRVLQEGRVVRIGGSREIDVDLRLVAATNRDLEAEVARGRFREDLFYRLNVIPIRLPALSERREDIPALVTHFLEKVNRDNRLAVGLTPAALDVLVRQPWPGNIRQLGNFIERAVLLAGGDVLDVEDIAAFLGEARDVGGATGSPGRSGTPAASAIQPLARPYLRVGSHGADALREALDRAGGNKSRAARLLELTERQFSYRWRKLGT